MDRECSILAWAPSTDVGPIVSTDIASAACRIAREARSWTDLVVLFTMNGGVRVGAPTEQSDVS
jgi:hypothetical protein